MNDKVEAFLTEQKTKEKIKSLVFYNLILEYAGLVQDEEDFIATTKAEYLEKRVRSSNDCKFENGCYYVKKKIPLEISDEEFETVVKSIPADQLTALSRQSEGFEKEEESSWAEKFFTIIAWVLWILGIIIAVSGAKGTRYTYSSSEFDITTFFSIYATYFIGGCLSFCAAELFKKLQQIIELLKKIHK